ncbi:MAG: lysophospholipid acyltransferase family protein, partial [Balneolaceae bacterium]
QEYHPGRSSRTVYYLNHNSWWDGLIPLLLNECRFEQHARALMEEKQMRQYPFFSRIGAFSIDPGHPRKALRSMQYAVESMQRERASLFIYPEGEIRPAGTPLRFKKGLAWLHGRLPGADIVPIAIHIHTRRYDKPELLLHTGGALSIPEDADTDYKNRLFEQQLSKLLKNLNTVANPLSCGFERLH